MSGVFKEKRKPGVDKYYIQDDENTMLYNPLEMHGSKFWGQVQKQYTIVENLNTELQHKYLLDYNSYFKAQAEIGSITHCFDKCISDVT